MSRVSLRGTQFRIRRRRVRRLNGTMGALARPEITLRVPSLALAFRACCAFALLSSSAFARPMPPSAGEPQYVAGRARLILVDAREDSLRAERIRQERIRQQSLHQEALREERLREERLRDERLRQERLQKERLEEERLQDERQQEQRMHDERVREKRLRERRQRILRCQNDLQIAPDDDCNRLLGR